MILGISEAPRDGLVHRDGRAPAGAGARHPEGSRRGEPVVVHRRRRDQHDAQQRAHPDQPEAARGAARRRHRHHSPAPAGARARGGHHPLHAAGAGPDRREPREPHAVSSTPSRTPTRASSPSGRRGSSSKLRALPGAARRGERPAGRRPQASLVIDRDTASRLGILPQAIDDTLYDAFGQRQVSTIFTQLNQYHVVLEVAPRFQQDPEALKSIYVKSASGAQVPLERLHAPRARARRRSPSTTRASSPSVTLSFNLAPGVVAGRRRHGHPRRPSARSACRPRIHASFQGTAQAFQASLANEPLLILAALITVYIVLGVLYESYIHPITILSTLPSAGVGAILALLLVPHGPRRHRADRHHPADRHRQEERDHDDRLRARRRARGGQAARRGHLPGLPAPLPPHHDDDAWRRCSAACRSPSARAPAPSCGARSASRSWAACSSRQLLTLYTTPVVYLAFDRLARRLRRSPAGRAVAVEPAHEGPAA